MNTAPSKHVVVDANQLGHQGHVDIKKVRWLAKGLAIDGRELWIPRPVAWEWAEHAASAVTELGQIVRQGLALAAPVVLDAIGSKAGMTDRALDALASVPNVKILEVPSSGWEAGVRDQVLNLGAGKRKSDVKTGAADTASVHAAHAADPTATSYVVLSADKDWSRVYEVNDWPLPQFETSARTLFRTTSKNVDDFYAVLEAARADPIHLEEAVSGYEASRWTKPSRYPRVGMSQLNVQVLDVVGIDDGAADTTEQLFFVTLRFTAVAEIVLHEWDAITELWGSVSSGLTDVVGTVDVAINAGQVDKPGNWAVNNESMTLELPDGMPYVEEW